MADISKINVNSTTYNLKDSRLPDLNSSTSQYLRGDGTWADPTVSTISSAADVTDNGTYMTIEPSSLTPTVTVNLQTKTGITPSTSSQTITADSGYDGLSSVQINAMPSGTAGTPSASKGSVSNHQISITPSVTNTSGYITGGTKTGTAITVTASELVSGTRAINDSGTYDVTNYADVDVNVSSMNVQMYNGYDYTATTSYTATDVTLTVAKTGTYDVSWVGWRNTTSGTSGTQLYINDSAYGSANTTFEGSYGQSVNLTGVSLSAEDVLVVRARARSTSYRMYVANLVIVQTA